MNIYIRLPVKISLTRPILIALIIMASTCSMVLIPQVCDITSYVSYSTLFSPRVFFLLCYVLLVGYNTVRLLGNCILKPYYIRHYSIVKEVKYHTKTTFFLYSHTKDLEQIQPSLMVFSTMNCPGDKLNQAHYILLLKDFYLNLLLPFCVFFGLHLLWFLYGILLYYTHDVMHSILLTLPYGVVAIGLIYLFFFAECGLILENLKELNLDTLIQ